MNTLTQQLVVPKELLPERYRGNKIITLYQQPYFGHPQDVAAYFVGELRGQETTLQESAHSSIPQIQGLELIFKGVSDDFMGVLKSFVYGLTVCQPRRPSYRTTEELLDSLSASIGMTLN